MYDHNDTLADPRDDRGRQRTADRKRLMNDDTVLRRIARESIAKGVLPDRSPEQTWGGPGTGVQCALCEATVTRDELEFEVDFGRERYHLHLACFSAWDAERKSQRRAAHTGLMEGRDESRPASKHSSSSSTSDSARVLPDRRADGKMAVDGGERSYKPGAA